MFPNIKRTRSQIMNHMKYIYTKKSQEHFINDKVQSSHVQCILEEIKEPIFTQLLAKHDVQSNKIKHNVNIKETTHNSIYINICNKQIQNVPIIPCFNCERLCFIKKRNYFSNQLSRQLSIYFQIQIEPSSTSYICTSHLHNINENKPLLH
jgi:hypothetical protein